MPPYILPELELAELLVARPHDSSCPWRPWHPRPCECGRDRAIALWVELHGPLPANLADEYPPRYAA